MLRKCTLTITIALLSSISIFAQNTYVQVEAEPGILVFLDGLFQGHTNAVLGGLIIEIPSEGTYRIKVVKPGFSPQEEEITIKKNEVFRYKVRPFQPGVKIWQKGNQESQSISIKTGSLKIQSIPINIEIKIEALGLESYKTKDEWFADNIPIGTYYVTFSWKNKLISGDIFIAEDSLTSVFIDLLKGSIEDKGIEAFIETEQDRREKEKARSIEQANRPGDRCRNTFGRDQGVITTVDYYNYGEGSGPSYGLGSRKVDGTLSLPNVENCNVTSRIVVTVEIQVDRDGNVVSANVSSATFADNCIWSVVVATARKTKFTRDAGASYRQTGWIKYTIEP